MPTIGNNPHSLIHGLSDFWLRFYADYEELDAMYTATEVQMAQVYLDMLSSFLAISINDCPIFNTELFKLVLAREDRVTFDQATNPFDDRHVLGMPDTMVSGTILQNKVIDPTASLEEQAGFEIDSDEYEFRFETDPSGQPGRILASTTAGNLLTHGLGQLTRFYTVDEATFANAKVGYYLRISNSGSNNNKTFRIAQLIDDDTILLDGTFTLPDVNSGSLVGEMVDSEFTPEEGFANRSLTVTVGGSFDDAALRATREVNSWYMDAPAGLGVRKGDILRVTDREAVAETPTDFDIVLVRHDKIYLSSLTKVLADAPSGTRTSVDFAILREPNDTDITEEEITFAQTVDAGQTPNSGTDGSLTWDSTEGAVKFSTAGGAFLATDAQRFITIGGGGNIEATCNLYEDGRLIVDTGASTMDNPWARASVGGTITIVGSSYNDGTYTIASIESDTQLTLTGTFTTEFIPFVLLDNVKNDGVYRIRKVLSGLDEVLLDVPACFDDLNNGSLTWSTHDGVKVSLAHTRIVADSVTIYAGAGDQYTGGRHDVVENEDYVIDYEQGVVLQTGFLAGTWGVTTPPQPRADYSWLLEVLATSQIDDAIDGDAADNINAATRTITFDQTNAETALYSTTGFHSSHIGATLRISNSSDAANNRDYTIESVTNTYTVVVEETPNSTVTEDFMGATDGVYGSGILDSTDTEAQVTEVAMWAPDAQVDMYHLYNNFGYFINRFEPSSETYRQFIRGVFQLYIMGPTIERIEAAFNVIADLPVIRDDDEVLDEYDTSDSEYDYIRTIRVNGEQAEYQFPKDTPIRDDITAFVAGTSDDIFFEAFEPLTTMFLVTDYVQDPTWWESIIIPGELLPSESTARRTTVPVLWENTIGQSDDPRIGDPGLFIGADDEGVVPEW